MTISESLLSLSVYPIPANTIEKICVNRSLTSSDTYAGTSQNYELAEADVYMFLYTSPDISEQEVSFSQSDRERFLNMANVIYGTYSDSKYSGKGVFGYKGDNWN